MRVFTEIQRIPVWIYMIVVPSFVLTASLTLYSYLYAGMSPTGKKQMLAALIIIISLESLALFFISIKKQVIRIDASGLYYTYPPFKTTEVHIPVFRIKGYEPVNYPFFYYGYRIGFWNVLKREPSMTTIGNTKAVRIMLKDGKSLLIGTKKPGDFIRTLDYITQKQE